jgi:formylglycine-generating enzyme required for sulfatase activity
MTTLTTGDLFSQWGLPPGSLICCGNAFDRNQAWTFKHRTASANGATATDTELAGRIEMKILGYSDVDTSKPPQSVAPSGSVRLGRVTRTATVKLTVCPSGSITHEFWGSLISSFNAVQEKGRTDASWVPLSMSMRLGGWTEAIGPADGGAAVLTMTLGSFKRLTASSGTEVTGFVKIPGGTYQMGNLTGDSDVLAAGTVSVTLSPYYIAVNDTTKSQWDAVRTWALTNGYMGLAVGAGKASNHPVQTVTWYDVVKWANAASEKEGLTPCYKVNGAVFRTWTSDAVTCDWSANGYRLPTEAEWEVAARGGLSGKRFPWGDTISQTRANYVAIDAYAYDTSGAVNDIHPTYKTGEWPYTSPVGSFAANGFGLYDMAGNVYQWCWDWFGTPYAGGVDPQGAATGSGRVLRGGPFNHGAFSARCANRSDHTPTGVMNNNIGFRLARGRI